MCVIGLTGGIGSGKSTVAQVLKEEGAVVLSADLLGHQVYEPGRPAWQEIVDAFGREVVAPDGTIERKRLRDIVFSNAQDLARLNAITHPRLKEMMREKLQDLERSGAQFAVLEAALLFDAGWEDLVDEVWVTVAPAEVAARRAAERGGIPAGEVLERIMKAQMSDAERVKRSDVVINTDCEVEETRGRARREWLRLKERLAMPSAQTNV